ncbi:phage baseplate assembly protein V [Pseudonocardia broussonetiae]|uniref:Baseplate assembly protein n=1 Tax=Pseudonocardia broussonetiae TaxID=2736640 RepID=A0A6M6JLM0_9PSEU|nr:phage baseplate assembly protein V [Pseudonocardia broussonetiae]QJY47960.1 baseplate assembly protein [Pseudonocardia broussonetiae]
MSPTSAPANRYYGKYRGVVVNAEDPERRGRLMATVPDVLGLVPSTWAMPCLPFAGIQSGTFMVPPMGAGIWMEFEQGEIAYPIWTGCWWGSGAEVPALAQAAPASVSKVVVQTTGQNTLMLSDVPGPTGGILLKTTTGALISVNDTGITISNGKGATIVMSGPTVTVNAGALTIT